MSLRILKVTQAYEPFLDKGGPAVKVPALARRLAQRGHAVTVLTADLGLGAWGLGVRDWRLDVGETEGANFPHRPTPKTQNLTPKTQHPKPNTIYLPTWFRYRNITFNPSVLPFCLKRLKEFDVVHIYGLYDLLGPVVASFCRRFGIPYLVEPMGMFRPIVRNIRLKRLYLRLLGRRMVLNANAVIATSEQERQELIEDGVPEERVVLRRNGIEAPDRLPERGAFRKQWRIPSDTKVILFLGRLVPIKSPNMLMDAFAECLKKLGDNKKAWLLALVGPNEGDGYREYLQAYGERLGISERLLFTGPLYGDEKWATLQDADVFVLPSQYESFGNAAAEAIAVGTPVIVTDRCGIAPMVHDQAGLVVPYEREALTEALWRLLTDEALRDRFRQGCRKVAESLSWDEPVTQMERLYEALRNEKENASWRPSKVVKGKGP
jgi:glycosyltransferase involved in cell wall biosynthesis